MKCNEYPLYEGKSKALATAAMAVGLSMSHHDGFRFFLSTDGEYVDFFRGDHLVHCKTLAEARMFFIGFVAGRKAAYQNKPT